MPPSDLIWDSCCLLNAAATGRMEEIVQTLECNHYVVGEVRQAEAFKLRPLPEEGQTVEFVEYDLTPFIESGMFREVEMTSSERATFERFAVSIDDGEAKTAAVALHRGFWVATDDRGAIRLMNAQNPPIPVLSTLQWLKHWAEAASLSSKDIGRALYFLRWRGRFQRPRRNSANAELCDWWDEHYPQEPED